MSTLNIKLLRHTKKNNNIDPIAKLSESELRHMMGGSCDNNTSVMTSGEGCGTATCVCLCCDMTDPDG